ncbi:MAG: 3-deoxy-8-phosphooctulonate synthase, partial [Gemmataceae bacterium]
MTTPAAETVPVPPVTVGAYRIGDGQPLALILGPCVIETEELTLSIARTLHDLADKNRLPIIFKASFDKANRSSGKNFRGVGIDEGLRILEKVRSETGLPVTTDVHEAGQAAAVGQVCDVLQVPAFLARQTDLIIACGQTGRVVNVKKGQFMAPWDMKNVVAKLAETGNRRVLLTERGTTFGYGLLVND